MNTKLFVSYNSRDRTEALALVETLQEHGIECFIDVWGLTPGEPWSAELKAEVESSTHALVLIGDLGLGPIQVVEVFDFLREAEKRKVPIIPTILKSCGRVNAVPDYLMSRTWVDLRDESAAPLQRLLDGLRSRPSPDGRFDKLTSVTDHPLHRYPKSPAVFSEHISSAITSAYGDLFPEDGPRKRVVADANRLRIEADPGCAPNAYIRQAAIPPATTPGDDFWWQIFVHAGKVSPRMLASLLLVVEPTSLPESIREKRDELLSRLETWK